MSSISSVAVLAITDLSDTGPWAEHVEGECDLFSLSLRAQSWHKGRHPFCILLCLYTTAERGCFIVSFSFADRQ